MCAAVHTTACPHVAATSAAGHACLNPLASPCCCGLAVHQQRQPLPVVCCWACWPCPHRCLSAARPDTQPTAGAVPLGAAGQMAGPPCTVARAAHGLVPTLYGLRARVPSGPHGRPCNHHCPQRRLQPVPRLRGRLARPFPSHFMGCPVHRLGLAQPLLRYWPPCMTRSHGPHLTGHASINS